VLETGMLTFGEDSRGETAKGTAEVFWVLAASQLLQQLQMCVLLGKTHQKFICTLTLSIFCIHIQFQKPTWAGGVAQAVHTCLASTKP
jgi:hypothetical protein